MASSLTFQRQLRQIGVQIREATRCTECGKPRVVLNTAGHRSTFVGETVTVDSHCSCVGGPAYGLRAREQTPAQAPDTVQPEHPEHPDGVTLCAFCGRNPPVSKGACAECC
jgi:hypothetical protein